MSEPRIAPLTDPGPEVQEILDKTQVRPGPPLNIFATMAHHPRLLKRFNVLGGLFLGRGLVPEREREVVILRTGWRARCEYEFGQHTVIGRRAGLTDAEIRRLAGGAGAWTDDDALLVRLADEIYDTRDVSDELWAALSRRWTPAELIELVTLAGFYGMVSAFLNSARVQLDDGVPGWP
ncbi:MAG TPA: carboxymuconolactone decarboxylase family protein [Candidatus Dormibacteraeota bacterium]|nr:carboxymuconolactone decarboxylase family protein [Candidatus Dormibacteraeota bacterium]